MAAFEWNPALETGNAAIDHDHKMIFGLANQLGAAAARQDGGSVVDHVLNALCEHTRMHFEREEKVMREAGYPETEVHTRHHGQMLFMLQHFLMRRQDTTGRFGMQALSEDMMIFLEDWIRLHIEYFDKRMVEYITAQQRPSTTV